ncbi:hypothetical protein LC593_09760 [Nostoc sp. CHAB 5844]|nr:hypothetical protein [Nostoc sp. CHAB 5844]
MTVGKADDTCFNALNPRNAVSPQRTAHRNALAPQPTPKFMKVGKNKGLGFLSSESD